jgi:hypothetical protein
MDLGGWVSESEAFWTYRPDDDDAWESLATAYGGHQVLRECLHVAREGGCKTVVVENRYVDADYRSEFSAFWSLKFAGRPGFARRMHFFAEEIEDAAVHAVSPDAAYLGYVVLRPVSTGTVGRAVLKPPPRITDQRATLATISDRVSFFGTELHVTGVPFCQQDGEFIRCAHAAAWICHFTAYGRAIVPRHVTAKLVEYSPTLLSFDRPLPSTGMNYHQMQAVFNRLGQPALMYALGSLPTVQGVDEPTPPHADAPGGEWDTRLFSVICRYLNSGFPVLVGTLDHAFVIVGYYEEQTDDGKLIRFIACDDQVGPYEVIDNPLRDGRRGPWEALMVPLPPRAWLPGEAAENDAYETLFGLQFGDSNVVPEAWIDLGRRVASNDVSLRTMLIPGREYKQKLLAQNRPADVVRELRLARLSNWVWVVEAHDRDARTAGNPCVLADFVYDSTSFELPTPNRLAVSYPGLTVVVPPDKGKSTTALGSFSNWRSQLLG